MSRSYRTSFSLIWTNDHAKRCAHLVCLLKLCLQRINAVSLTNASLAQCQHGIQAQQNATCTSNVHTAEPQASRSKPPAQAMRSNQQQNRHLELAFHLKLNKPIITTTYRQWRQHHPVRNLYLKKTVRV